jgi:hypothetical protein
MRNRQWNIKAIRVCSGLSSRVASFKEALDVLLHLGKVVTVGDHGKGRVMAKVYRKETSM